MYNQYLIFRVENMQAAGESCPALKIHLLTGHLRGKSIGDENSEPFGVGLQTPSRD